MEGKRKSKSIICKCIVSTTDKPDEAHSETAGRFF